MNYYYELLPVLSGLLIGTARMFPFHKIFLPVLCLIGALLANALSGEGWTQLPADLGLVMVTALATGGLLRRLRMAR